MNLLRIIAHVALISTAMVSLALADLQQQPALGSGTWTTYNSLQEPTQVPQPQPSQPQLTSHPPSHRPQPLAPQPPQPTPLPPAPQPSTPTQKPQPPAPQPPVPTQPPTPQLPAPTQKTDTWPHYVCANTKANTSADDKTHSGTNDHSSNAKADTGTDYGCSDT